MIRITDIQDALLHLVGWEQSFNPSKKIGESIVETESGLFFQNAHPLFTLENIESTMPQDFAAQYANWAAGEYNKGDKVAHGGKYWIALKNSVSSEPTTSVPEDWENFNPLTDYLIKLTKDGIAKVVQTFIQLKELNKETRNVFERRTFFDGAAKLKATITPSNKIVGMEIVPVRALGVTFKIHKIGLQMVGGTGNVTFYLFHSSQKAPIKTFTVNFTNTNGGFQWFSFDDIFLPYMGSNTDAGGAWYLCYDQSQLPLGVEALNVSKDWSREPCGTCNIGSLEVWRELTKYMQISPFCTQAPTTFAQNPRLWDIEQNIYTPTMNYGINCEVSVGCDLTDFIIEQRHMFQTVLQRQVAVDTLRMMAMNPGVRVNRNQSNVSRMDILYELDGNTQSSKPQGLGVDLRRAYDALSLDTRGLDRICLKCQNGGVKYRTV